MNQYFNGPNETVITFEGNTLIGELVTILSNGIVTKAVADKDIIGICVSKRRELNGIQLRGVITIGYTGTAPTLGYNVLQTASATAVKTAATGQSYLVLNVDTTTKQVSILL